MTTLYFAEYMKAGSGVPVDVTFALGNKNKLIRHARVVSAEHGYCGFWVSCKEAKAGIEPTRLEFHPVRYAPNGKPVYGNVIITNKGN